MFSRAFFVTGIERFDAGRTHKLLAGGFFNRMASWVPMASALFYAG
jgi:hypothetical protein